MSAIGRQQRLLFVSAATVAAITFWTSCIQKSENHELLPSALETPAPDGKREQRFREPLSVGQIVTVEKLILELGPELSRLARAVTNLRLPDPKTLDLLAAQLDLVDIVRVDSIPNERTLTKESQWHVGAAARAAREELAIWQPFMKQVRYIDEAEFKIVDGSFISADRQRFETFVEFEAEAVLETGRNVGVHAEVTVQWASSGGQRWVIDQWITHDLRWLESPSTLFTEVLDAIVPNNSQREKARRSLHEEMIVHLLQTDRLKLPKKEYYDYFTTDSNNQHPGIAVVDIEGDGDDDLYVTARWGKNQLWINQGDGRFFERAESYGLDIDGLCNCSIFADFDNDGDQDVFVGRSLERSLFLFNEDGRFQSQPDRVLKGDLPYLVSTASGCDFNADGLLDLFLGTYGPTLTVGQSNKWSEVFLTHEQQLELRRRTKQSHRYFDLVGPPNLLLLNRGDGCFERAPESAQLEDYRNTYQGTWSDFDNDGDPDLYVCNDFAPDALYRNEGANNRGQVRFTDVSVELSDDTMKGFGMGASWGDYDGDGDQDLYVSNMYSKAGRRIVKQVGNVDPRITYSAQGNLLFRNDGSVFSQVAGLWAPAMTVAKVGWSFGGQFADVDNDGWLDLYVPSGFYSSPPTVSTNVDL